MAHWDGFFLVNKDPGISSFKAVKKIRGLTRVKRVGHAGTLDPFASGLLAIAIGRPFTRQIDQIQAWPKTYEGRLVLGMATDTLDAYGQITDRDPTIGARQDIFDGIDDVLSTFVGDILQMPPQFSARKIDGVRAYKLARKGEEVPLEPRPVHIASIEVLATHHTPFPILDFRVHCSKGTYIRSLARDIAEALGTVAYLKDLHRSAIGPLQSAHASLYSQLTLDDIRDHRFFSLAAMEGAV